MDQQAFIQHLIPGKVCIQQVINGLDHQLYKVLQISVILHGIILVADIRKALQFFGGQQQHCQENGIIFRQVHLIFLPDPLVNGFSKGIFIVTLDILLLHIAGQKPIIQALPGNGQACHNPYHFKGMVSQLDPPGIFCLHDHPPDAGGIHSRCVGTNQCFHDFRQHFQHIILNRDPEAVLFPCQTYPFIPHSCYLYIPFFKPAGYILQQITDGGRA